MVGRATQGGGGGRDAVERGEAPPSPGRPAYAQPLSPWRKVPDSMAFVTDNNRPQPLWQPPPTACLTLSGAASEVPALIMHPWGRGRGRGGSKGRGHLCIFEWKAALWTAQGHALARRKTEARQWPIKDHRHRSADKTPPGMY